MSEGGLYLEDMKGHGWIIREMSVLHLCFINKIRIKHSQLFFFFLPIITLTCE